MSAAIILDSSPLGLLFQKPGITEADKCRDWLKGHLTAGRQIVVPEIVSYELRRELLRMGKSSAVRSLAEFVEAAPNRYLPITREAMDLAAELWAEARRTGKATASPDALDVDVILAAQVRTQFPSPQSCIVATNNLAHLRLFVPAEDWSKI